MVDQLKEFDLKCVVVDVHHFDPSSISVQVYSNTVVISASHPEQSDEHGFATRSFRRIYRLAEEIEPSSVSVVINPARFMVIRALEVGEFLNKTMSSVIFMENYISPDNIDLLGDSLLRETRFHLHEKVMNRLQNAIEAYDKGLVSEMNQVGDDLVDGDNKKKSRELKKVGVPIPLEKLVLGGTLKENFSEQIKPVGKRRALKRPYARDDPLHVPSTSKACEEPLFRDQDTIPDPSRSKACKEPLFRDQDKIPDPSRSKACKEPLFRDQDKILDPSTSKACEEPLFRDQDTIPDPSNIQLCSRLCEEPESSTKDTSPILARKFDEKQTKSSKDTISECEFSAQRRNRKRSTDQPTPPEVSEYKKSREEEQEDEDSL